jgi:2-polyprenyl-3-methyl-5-hydroxy-6-metoxy-1,4-benzoquinol methylase
VDPKYSERYRDLFEKHWWWRARTDLIVRTLRRLRPAQRWNNILDIGCGDGLFFDRLSEFGEVEGVEPCADLVNPNNIHRSRIYVCPFDEKFQPGKQYSLILMLDVLEHLENPVAALRHALSLLAENGTFVATVPAFMALWTNHDVLNHHLTRYTKSSFSDLAQKAGLQIRSARYLYHWTCPVKLGQRFAERVFRTKPDTPQIPSAWINELLYRITKAESTLSPLLPMPFGSSLIVVGSKEKSSAG